MEVTGITPPPEEAKENKSSDIRRDMKELLDAYHEDHPLNDEGRELQQWYALENLPDNFLEQYRDRLNEAKEEEFLLPREMDGQMDGLLFEFLVRADREICPAPESLIGQTVRELMHNPHKFHAEDSDIGFTDAMYQPDLVEVVHDNVFKFRRAFEMKLTHIDMRGVAQLNNFMHTFKESIKILKKASSSALKAHGLGILADKKSELEVSNDFERVLVVSHDAWDGNDKSMLLAKGMDEKQKQEGRSVLGRCTIKTSPFSEKEISILRNMMRSRLGMRV